jgi:hypothetical protein
MFPVSPDRRYYSRVSETVERKRGKLEFLYPNLGVVFPSPDSPARKLQEMLDDAFRVRSVGPPRHHPGRGEPSNYD